MTPGLAAGSSSSRIDTLEKLTEDGDLLLICKDDKQVTCHRVLLAICSPVLKELLALHQEQGSMPAATGSAPAPMNVKDDDSEAWTNLLRLVYPIYPPATLSWVSQTVGTMLPFATKAQLQ